MPNCVVFTKKNLSLSPPLFFQGDSGGPLLRDGLAIGINSAFTATSDNECPQDGGNYNFAIKIVNYLSFIKYFVPEITVVSH